MGAEIIAGPLWRSSNLDDAIRPITITEISQRYTVQSRLCCGIDPALALLHWGVLQLQQFVQSN